MEPVHYIDSVIALAQQERAWKWTPAHTSVVLALWSKASNPVAVRPNVSVTQEELRSLLNVKSPSYVAKLIAELRGVAFMSSGTGGQRRMYSLLRPTEHETVNANVLDIEGAAAERRATRSGKPRPSARSKGEIAGDYGKLAEKFGRDRSIIARQLQEAFGGGTPKYTGPEVHAVFDWLMSREIADDSRSIDSFDALLELAVNDPNKPELPKRLFMSCHKAWRERLYRIAAKIP